MEIKAKLGAKAMGGRALENNEGYELRSGFPNSYNHLIAPFNITMILPESRRCY